MKENEEWYPEIDFISPNSIAHTAAILIDLLGDDFVLARNDWSKWYRQLRKSSQCWWLQGAFSLPGGVTIDKRLM